MTGRPLIVSKSHFKAVQTIKHLYQLAMYCYNLTIGFKFEHWVRNYDNYLEVGKFPHYEPTFPRIRLLIPDTDE